MMKTNHEIRYTAHADDARNYNTKRLRRDFLIEKEFSPNEVNRMYSMYDPHGGGGGAMPTGETLDLKIINPLKAPYFLTRHEMDGRRESGLCRSGLLADCRPEINDKQLF